MSMQQLEDRTAELGMRIPRSVLANLESGRRETVSVAEALVLAAALNVAPIELICPVGFDKQTEMLPGRDVDALDAMRWFTGERILDVVDVGTILSEPAGFAERSSTYLVKQHDQLINVLREQEADAAKAIADAADDRTRAAASYRMSSLAELRRFIRETLGRLRAEMRNRGMLLPDLPPDIELGDGDA